MADLASPDNYFVSVRDLFEVAGILAVDLEFEDFENLRTLVGRDYSDLKVHKLVYYIVVG